MRTIHLGFQLHEPYQLKEFSGEEGYFLAESFKKANEDAYQPFFAFLERTTQRYKQFHFSLAVSGIWLELAERYDPELVRRLKKLVGLKQVELVVSPYYYSLAVFYSEEELAEQVRLYREKIEQLFGVNGRIFCLPELIYNDQIAKIAEDLGFAGMLAAGPQKVLGWHSPNHVYEAHSCEYLRVLFENEHLTKIVTTKSPEILAEKKFEEGDKVEMHEVLSAKRFQKALDLDCLRGNLVNLYFDARVFCDLRKVGVIGFFDELVRDWLEVSGNRFVGAAEACTVETPMAEMVIEGIVSTRGGNMKEESAEKTEGYLPVAVKEIKVPSWLDEKPQREIAKALYDIRREILASEDERLIADFRRLLTADYQIEMREKDLGNWQKILADLKRRANETKKSQAVEISRAWTKKRDRVEIVRSVKEDTKTADDAVKVNFGMKRDAGVAGASVHGGKMTAEEVDDVVPVRRLPRLEAVEEETAQKSAEEELEKKPKRRGVRRIVKRIVLE